MLKFVIFVCFLAVQTVKADECAKGPEYWCSSLDNAVECGSFKHCLDTVWTKHARFLSRPLGLEGETLNPNKCQNCVLCLQSNIEKCPMARKHSKQVHEMVARDIPRRTICELLNHCDKPQEDSDETKAKEFFSNIKIKFFETAQTVVETPLSPKSLKETNGMACELCNIVFTAAKYLIQNKVEQEKVFGFIEEQLCARLGAYNSTCVDLIEKEGAELLEIISNSYQNAAEACRKLGLCSKNQIGTAERPVELLNLSVEKNNANCTLCKLTMLQVKHMLLNGKSQKEILDYFNSNLCARIGKSKDLCTTFIDQYGPMLLEFIGKDINPDQLCVMLGFCAKATSQVVRVHLQKDVQMPKVEGDTTCVICEFAMNLLVKYVNQNTSAPEVEKWLEYICNTEMPKPIRNECSAFVAQYGPIIISLLIKQVDPKKICETIGACPKTQTVLTSFDASIVQPNSNDVKDMPVAKVPTPKKEITCSLCKLVMQYVDEKMEVDRTTQLLQLTVDNMCNMVPKRLRSECESLVDKYGVKLLNFIKQNTDPELVCAHIKVCEAQEAEVAWANIKPSKDMKFTGQDDIKINSIHEHVSAKNGSLECSLCLYVAELVDSLLKQNKTDQEIVAELKQVCKLFPSSLKDQCDAFINEYGVYVIQVLAADLDPQATCTLLKLCDSSIIGFTPRKTRYPF